MLTAKGAQLLAKAFATMSYGGRLVGPLAQQAKVNLRHAEFGLIYEGNGDVITGYGQHYRKLLDEQAAKACCNRPAPMVVKVSTLDAAR